MGGEGRRVNPDRILTLDLPGLVADFLTEDGTAAMEEGTNTRMALLEGQEIRRGRGYSLRVTAPAKVHLELLGLAWVLGDGCSSASDNAAYRRYRDRIDEKMSESGNGDGLGHLRSLPYM
jgi:putative DNA-invertase from lambdoid prophage Rac